MTDQEKRIADLERELEREKVIFDYLMTLADEALSRKGEISDKLCAALKEATP